MELPGFVASKKWIFKNCGEMMWFHMYILRPVSTYLHFFFQVGPDPSKNQHRQFGLKTGRWKVEILKKSENLTPLGTPFFQRSS